MMRNPFSVWLSILSLIFLLFGCTAGKSPTVEERLQKAQEYESNQQYDEALKEYEAVIASSSVPEESVKAYYSAANIYYKQDNFDKAIFGYTKVLQSDPENIDVIYRRGVSYAVLKRPDPAEADLKKTIERKPTFAPAYYVLGDVYMTRGDMDQGISSLTRAIELDPSNPDYYSKRAAAYYNKGVINNSSDDHLRSIEDYTWMIEKAQEYNLALMYQNRGNGYLAIGENPKAIEDYSAAIELSPMNPFLHNNRGLAYLRSSKFIQAKEDFVKTVELDSEGETGKIAYRNLELLVKVLEEKAASPQPLSQDDIDLVNSLEKEWAMNIDKAVPLIQERNFTAANVYIEKARNSLSRINGVLVPKNYSTGDMDRIVAMNALTTVYSHLNELSAYASDPDAAVRDWAVVTGLSRDAHRGLNEAEAKFHEVPALQGLCRQIRALLNEIDTGIKKAMNAVGRY